MLEKVLRFTERLIPRKLYKMGQPIYHYLLMLAGALVYGFPARKLYVVGVTGTKGKTTVTELVNAMLEEAGYATALSSTLRFKIAGASERNIRKMTMPGRFAMQRLLRSAANAGCTHAILEITSEGVKQFRHRFLFLDALIFTNLSPEHIENHGSFETYRDAKRKIGRSLESSSKKNKLVVANADDKEGAWYLGLYVNKSAPYSIKDAKPFEKTADGHQWTFRKTLIRSHIPGTFNLYNQLAAATLATQIGIPLEHVKRALESFSGTRGRVEFVQKEPFAVVVDYAHTPDSLEQFYGVFVDAENVCVLGNTGGGRDAWKRPEMAAIAEKNCSEIILTNEDPYDEDPQKIVGEMAKGIKDKSKLSIILDRREAIRSALKKARGLVRQGGKTVNVLITGKGTDPYIMGPRGSKERWDDARVVREELGKL